MILEYLKNDWWLSKATRRAEKPWKHRSDLQAFKLVAAIDSIFFTTERFYISFLSEMSYEDWILVN